MLRRPTPDVSGRTPAAGPYAQTMNLIGARAAIDSRAGIFTVDSDDSAADQVVLPLSMVEGVDFQAGTASSPGYLRIRVRGLEPAADPREDPFGWLVEGGNHPLVRKLARLAGTEPQVSVADLLEEERQQAAPSLPARPSPEARFGSLRIGNGLLWDASGESYSLVGAKAAIETGDAMRTRVTATRVLGGAVLAGGIGALVGGMAKKTVGRVHLIVTLPDGTALSAEGNAKQLAEMHSFAALINANS